MRRTSPSLPSQQSASPGPDTPPALCGAEAAAEREPHCSRGCAVSCVTGTALKAARRAFNKASTAAGGRVKKARVGTPEGTKDMARMGMGGRQVLPTPSLRTTGFVDETRDSGVLPVPALFVISLNPLSLHWTGIRPCAHVTSWGGAMDPRLFQFSDAQTALLP